MEPALSVGGFREWFPLALDTDPDEYADMVVEHFADDPTPPETLRMVAAGLTGLTEQLTEALGDTTLLLGAWVLLPPGGRTLDIRTVARLEAVRVRPGTTPAEMVADLVSESQLHQPPNVEQIETASGVATLLRNRTYSTTDHGTELQEVVCIFWLPADENYAIALTSIPMTDLVMAADVSDAMIELARSVKGAR
ncbi:hypothetical protein [Aeromicrobium fastidiosum]|uniref:hypothetical protein n=1 Tax=Aeromicrobium fastidiosum TaxID=52699 RepID=UPI00100FC993|nr:hypothetical protein [Aeromicrobium fastidiosum]